MISSEKVLMCKGIISVNINTDIPLFQQKPVPEERSGHVFLCVQYRLPHAVHVSGNTPVYQIEL